MRNHLREMFGRFLRWLICPAEQSRQKDRFKVSLAPPIWSPPIRWQPPAAPALNDGTLVRPYFLAYEARVKQAAGRPLGGEC
ncbi:hypothetical protein DQ392_17780 [Streptomyces reniochalinae]|uniref:Uncharacterized protein n=1 Tax=Streptomyces reniochalinae TaxID=2250578 RepID=A0A367EFR7_9ACTN|nr:hypothetical protein [Streptomyces reniochalinae]RCG16936.1 hypothetical protein DQ392_17780 [Streptomyces reniochalinae]